MPKESLKDKVEGNELDLSLSDLTVIPVKELAAIPKATTLDLSCNQLTTIPEDFCRLRHLVNLDLSKNALTVLPDNFGQLNRLQHLDLYSNQLQTLPLSFSNLRSLKWLDVRDNPLEEKLKAIAGDCLDDIQCKKCAINITSYMRKLESEQERIRQKLLKEEREQAAAVKAEEEREKQKQRAEKKAEKERRRKEYEAARAAQRQREEEKHRQEKQGEDDGEQKMNGFTNEVKKKRERAGLTCCRVFIALLFGLVAILLGLYVYCDRNQSDEFCRVASSEFHKLYGRALALYQHSVSAKTQ